MTSSPSIPAQRMAPVSQPLAFLSDVHGNLPALEAVLSDLARRAVVDVFVAGDLILGGDAPMDVWKRLQQVRARCVCGPSDLALARVDAASLRAQDEAEAEKVRVFATTQKALGELVLKRLAQLPRELRVPMIDGGELLLVHGSPKDHFEPITHDMDELDVRALLENDPADLVICGGTHVPFHRVVDDVQIVNVGSVGQAPEGRFAHYTIVSPRMTGPEIEQTWVEY
ncbi:MAG TPA: metallophosphoesterase family protein [Polyangiales bacterium]